MNILGIDPSFSRTGVSIMKEGKFDSVTSITVSNGKVYQMPELLKLSRLLATQVVSFLDGIDVISIEYPILSTRSGSYLGFIQQALFDKLHEIDYKGVLYLFPSQAINSVTKNKTKTKTFIVNWSKAKYKVNKINHDEASAMVLLYLAELSIKGEYPNSFSVIKF